MSHRVQFHEVCDAHLAHPEYTPLLKVHKLVQCCKVIWKNFTSLLKQRGLTSKFPKTICRYIFQEIVSEDCVSLYSIFAFKHLGPPIFKPIGGWPSPSRKYLKKFFFLLAARTYRFQFGRTRFEDVTHSLKHDRRLPRCVVFCESNWILNKFELSELIAKSGDYLKLKIKFMYLSSICSFPSSKVKQQYFQHVFSVP